jgi:NitT/TauT family transport system permease protein
MLLPFRLEFWSRGRLFRTASYLFALVLWEVVGRSVGPLFLAGPSQVVVSLVNVTLSGELPLALLVSLQAFLVGFVAAIIVGIPLGMLMGRFESVERFFEPYISAFFVTPVSAFVPMIIIWFGIGIEARVIVVFSFSFFDIVINTFNGVRDIQYELVEPVRSLGANQRQTFQKVVLPAGVSNRRHLRRDYRHRADGRWLGATAQIAGEPALSLEAVQHPARRL